MLFFVYGETKPFFYQVFCQESRKKQEYKVSLHNGIEDKNCRIFVVVFIFFQITNWTNLFFISKHKILGLDDHFLPLSQKLVLIRSRIIFQTWFSICSFKPHQGKKGNIHLPNAALCFHMCLEVVKWLQ